MTLPEVAHPNHVRVEYLGGEFLVFSSPDEVVVEFRPGLQASVLLSSVGREEVVEWEYIRSLSTQGSVRVLH